MGDAMRTVAAAFSAVSDGRFAELEPLISTEIDWRGVPEDAAARAPRCQGRATALERMREGLLAGGEVSVSALIEEGDRVLARVSGARSGEPGRFVVAEVRGGQITELRGYASEAEAEGALRTPVMPDATVPLGG